MPTTTSTRRHPARAGAPRRHAAGHQQPDRRTPTRPRSSRRRLTHQGEVTTAELAAPGSNYATNNHRSWHPVMDATGRTTGAQRGGLPRALGQRDRHADHVLQRLPRQQHRRRQRRCRPAARTAPRGGRTARTTTSCSRALWNQHVGADNRGDNGPTPTACASSATTRTPTPTATATARTGFFNGDRGNLHALPHRQDRQHPLQLVPRGGAARLEEQGAAGEPE